MSDDKDKLAVPKDEKQSSPATSRPVSPSILNTIQCMIGVASANLVKKYPDSPSTSNQDKMQNARGSGDGGVKIKEKGSPSNGLGWPLPNEGDGNGMAGAGGGSTPPPPPPPITIERAPTSNQPYVDKELEKLRKISLIKYKAVWTEMHRVETLLQNPNPDLKMAEVGLGGITHRIEDFGRAQEKFSEALLENDLMEDYEREEELIHDMFTHQLVLQQRLTDKQPKTNSTATAGQGNSSHQANASSFHPQIPHLKLPQYDGDVRGWMAFWEAFKPFDVMAVGDGQKLQYLLQSTVPGSEAHKVVVKIPPAAGSYKFALARLKERFGDPNTLIKVYMRDLVKLVNENSKDKPQLSFVDLVTNLTSQIQNLELLGIGTTEYGALLYPMVESCIPESILEVYLRDDNHQEEIMELLKFLNEEVRRKMQSTLSRAPFKDGKEACSSSNGGKQNSKSGKGPTTTTSFLNAGEAKKCHFCSKQNHSSAECRKAIEMTLDEKKDALKKANACFKCFSADKHNWKKCFKGKCLKCGKGHHTLMCYGDGSGKQQGGNSNQNGNSNNNGTGNNNGNGNSSSQNQQANTPPPPPPTGNSTQMSNYISRPEVQLKVLKITVYGSKGYKTVRAMYDDGSQSSSVLESLAEELGLQEIGKERTTHHLFGGHCTGEQVHKVFNVDISAPGGTNHYNFPCSGVKRVSGPIQSIPQGKWIDECAELGIEFSDVDNGPSEIQVLIGGDVAGKFTEGLKSFSLSSGPVAHETRLGWVLSGKLPIPRMTNASGAMMCVNMLCQSEKVEDLWKLEAIGITDEADSKSRREIEEAAMHHFTETVSRNQEGRFIVHLPWIEAHPSLPDNKAMAVKRLESLTRKLKQEGKLIDYDKVFRGWLEEGIIEVVPQDDGEGIVHYLPHRAVYKEGSTTPLRPVFDASARAKDSPSLNACLEKGPNLLELIPSILTRFRMNRVGAVADIKKAFLQMEVVPKDRNSMRFLWWKDVSKKEGDIVEHRHCRVVFGVSSSPFLLGATLMHLLEGSMTDCDSAMSLLKSFYVDNCVISLPSMEDVKKFEKEAVEMLRPAQFVLRGWEYGPSEMEKLISVLGLVWNTKMDSLQIEWKKLSIKDIPKTKREVLSLANAVYDPLGFVSPFTLLIKLLLKGIWCDDANYGWDKELSEAYQEQCGKWQKQLEKLQEIVLPRFIGGVTDIMSNWSLHVFCDASQEAYATCIFLRVEDGDQVRVQLVQSKTRVSPKKIVTIPRLELLSCLIGARLCKTVKTDMELPDIPVTYWSDSTTALTWIQRESTWATFVSNRKKEINMISPKEGWRHVPGEHNPADVCSRGCSLQKLITGKWWEGPSWLKLSLDQWPSSQPITDEEEVAKEKAKSVVSSVNVIGKINLFLDLLRLGDFTKMTRVLAFVRRFCKNAREKARSGGRCLENGNVPELTMKELTSSELAIVKNVQEESSDRLKTLRRPSCSKDEDGILRVQTRLFEGDTSPFNSPAVLPGRHPIVRLLIQKEHELALHAGVQYLQSLLRERYWVTRSRRNIGHVVNGCSVCRRLNTQRCQQDEAPLPNMRTAMGNAFETTGVDMAGPLFVENGKKVWICLFTCSVYRAVHIELVTSLTTQAFLEAFNKFVCRRGRPMRVFSDNGRNFVGASTLFRNIDMRLVGRYAATLKIEWKTIAPTASWWGGWWERMIGLLKGLLRKVLGSKRVKQCQLEVILCQAEAVMNERPLTYVSDDPNDLKPLTPAMFLKDLPSHELPETGLLTRLVKMTKMKNELRQRFRKEYLANLVHHGKTKKPIDLKPGDVVLVEFDNQKRQDWPVGLVLEVYPGLDGKVRAVKLRAKQGDRITEIVRPIQRLFPLEVMGNQMTAAAEEEDEDAVIDI